MHNSTTNGASQALMHLERLLAINQQAIAAKNREENTKAEQNYLNSLETSTPNLRPPDSQYYRSSPGLQTPDSSDSTVFATPEVTPNEADIRMINIALRKANLQKEVSLLRQAIDGTDAEIEDLAQPLNKNETLQNSQGLITTLTELEQQQTELAGELQSKLALLASLETEELLHTTPRDTELPQPTQLTLEQASAKLEKEVILTRIKTVDIRTKIFNLNQRIDIVMQKITEVKDTLINLLPGTNKAQIASILKDELTRLETEHENLNRQKTEILAEIKSLKPEEKTKISAQLRALQVEEAQMQTPHSSDGGSLPPRSHQSAFKPVQTSGSNTPQNEFSVAQLKAEGLKLVEIIRERFQGTTNSDTREIQEQFLANCKKTFDYSSPEVIQAQTRFLRSYLAELDGTTNSSSVHRKPDHPTPPSNFSALSKLFAASNGKQLSSLNKLIEATSNTTVTVGEQTYITPRPSVPPRYSDTSFGEAYAEVITAPPTVLQQSTPRSATLKSSEFEGFSQPATPIVLTGANTPNYEQRTETKFSTQSSSAMTQIDYSSQQTNNQSTLPRLQGTGQSRHQDSFEEASDKPPRDYYQAEVGAKCDTAIILTYNSSGSNYNDSLNTPRSYQINSSPISLNSPAGTPGATQAYSPKARASCYTDNSARLETSTLNSTYSEASQEVSSTRASTPECGFTFDHVIAILRNKIFDLNDEKLKKNLTDNLPRCDNFEQLTLSEQQNALRQINNIEKLINDNQQLQQNLSI